IDSLFFFFQAEAGIRDGHVTGVQTCALPIYARTAARHLRRRRAGPACARTRTAGRRRRGPALTRARGPDGRGRGAGARRRGNVRSEERRVGKEGRSWW